MNATEKRTATFKKYTGYQASIVTTFDKSLNGLKSYSWAFQSSRHNDSTAYNNWNMTSTRVWDSIEEGFWYAQETTVLYNTVTYTIGEK